MRNIQDILKFRMDVSQFLVHLTRDRTVSEKKPNINKDGFGYGDTPVEKKISASEALQSIIKERKLKCGEDLIGDAKFGIPFWEQKGHEDYFRALCFTETPLNEIHNLLEIDGRQVELCPYGLVFLKNKLATKNVSPVFYLNNLNGDKATILRGLCSLIKEDDFSEEAKKILPLFTFFGDLIKAPGASKEPPKNKQLFLWEREWRLPCCFGNLELQNEDIFIGLCPHDEITEFESLLPGISFVDPRRNMKWYATKLLEAKSRTKTEYTVV